MLDYLRGRATPGFFRSASEPNDEATVRPIPSNLFLLLATLACIASTGCQSGGVGDPCIPEDEYQVTFSGYSAAEVNVESRSFQCETRVCLAANFNGRVSCPYGQKAAANSTMVDTNGIAPNDRCYLPGAPVTDPNSQVSVPVNAQYKSRPPDKAVYCSCRCAGPDSNVNYCQCPSGYACQKLVTDYGFGSAQLAGSYCIKDGTQYNASGDQSPCNLTTKDCGSEHPSGI